MKDILSTIAGILFFLGFVPYIIAILKGYTKPAKASWVIWASLDTITLAGMYATGTINGQIIGAVAGVWVIVALAIKYGVPGWSTLDKCCLVGAVLGIVLWKLFSNPTLGIVTSQCVVFLGAIPTFVSTWKDPTQEDKVAWTIYWLSCVFAYVAIPRWTLEDAAQPITFLTIESIMMVLIWIYPIWKKPITNSEVETHNG